MFQMNKKKAVLLIACVVLVSGCVSMAAGKIAGIVGHTSNIPIYTKYSDLSKAEGEIGVTTYAPESFENGFMFHGVYKSHESRLDEEDNVLAEYDILRVEYKNGKTRVMLTVEPYDSIAGAENYYEEIEINGVTCYYLAHENKFVPGDYIPTAEEKKAMEEGRLNIGYGTDKIETSSSMQVCWNIEGNTHELFYMDENPVLSKEEFLKMAEECMNQ